MMIITREKFFTAAGEFHPFQVSGKIMTVSLSQAFRATFKLKADYAQAQNILETVPEIVRTAPDMENIDKLGEGYFDKLSQMNQDMIDEMILNCERTIMRLQDCQRDLSDIARYKQERQNNDPIQLTKASLIDEKTQEYLHKYDGYLQYANHVDQDVLAQIYIFSEQHRPLKPA